MISGEGKGSILRCRTFINNFLSFRLSWFPSQHDDDDERSPSISRPKRESKSRPARFSGKSRLFVCSSAKLTGLPTRSDNGNAWPALVRAREFNGN